jgi:hypothetical protein
VAGAGQVRSGKAVDAALDAAGARGHAGRNRRSRALAAAGRQLLHRPGPGG